LYEKHFYTMPTDYYDKDRSFEYKMMFYSFLAMAVIVITLIIF
jgi:hypothetical protein